MMNPAIEYEVSLYNSVTLNDRKVNTIALLVLIDEKPYAAFYSAEWLCAFVERNADKLIRVHDGVRLREIKVTENGASCRNLAMRALVKNAVMLVPIASKAGNHVFEKAVRKITDGRFFGSMKNHPCDVIAERWGRIECKGLGGAWHVERDKDGNIITTDRLAEIKFDDDDE